MLLWSCADSVVITINLGKRRQRKGKLKKGMGAEKKKNNDINGIKIILVIALTSAITWQQRQPQNLK